jgi:TPR repeat protein
MLEGMTDQELADLFWEAHGLMTADPEGAVARLTPAVEAGDSSAKYQLAVVLTERDPLTSARLWEELDAAGFAGAAWHLGCLLHDSDLPGAEYWLRRAATRVDMCSGSAALALGKILVSAHKPDEAATWLERAVAVGVEDAAFWLGYNTEGRDSAQACELYRDAIREGNVRAHYRLGRLLQLSGDLDGARDHFEQGASLGDRAAGLGLYHLTLWRHPIGKLGWLVRSAPAVYRRLHKYQLQQGLLPAADRGHSG